MEKSLQKFYGTKIILDETVRNIKWQQYEHNDLALGKLYRHRKGVVK